MTRLALVNINVADLDRSAAFYAEHFGFSELTRLTTPFGIDEVILGADDGGAGLVLLRDPTRTDPLAHGTAFSRVVLEIDDIAGRFDRLAAAGVPIVESPTPRTHFPITVGYFRDPDGYLVECYEVRRDG
ncbi:MAG: VOC family protein [Acidimicrobiia bacterium]|jgi:catechol 2,3-dioxygenase-like lactoylglutathione lyase family enzyme